jgi:hypothetical protein
MNYKTIINNILNKLNFLDSENRISITNITVSLFVTICAFRMLLGGSTLDILSFKWNIQTIDVSCTLPVLFSLLNYHGKRMSINQASNDEKDKA